MMRFILEYCNPKSELNYYIIVVRHYETPYLLDNNLELDRIKIEMKKIFPSIEFKRKMIPFPYDIQFTFSDKSDEAYFEIWSLNNTEVTLP